MALEGKRISELTEVSRVNKSSKLPIDTGGEEALSITLENLMESGVNAALEALQLITWVDVLPPTGSTKYLYAVPREEVDKDGKKIAALYLWDGSAWRGAGAFSLNIDPATLATKAELAGYLPLSGGTINGELKVVGPKSTIRTYSGNETSGYTYLELKAADQNQAAIILTNNKGETVFRQRGSNTEISNLTYNKSLIISSTLTFDNNKVLDASDKAVANGVASLDENAKVPENQLPDTVATKTDLDKYLPLIGGDMGQNLFTYTRKDLGQGFETLYYWNKLFNVADLPTDSWSIFLIVCKSDYNNVNSFSSLLYISRFRENESYSVILTPVANFGNNISLTNVCVTTDADKNVYIQGRTEWCLTETGGFKIIKLVGGVNFTPENVGEAYIGEAPTGITFLSKINDSGAYRVNLKDNSVTSYEDSKNLLKLTAKYAINDSKGNDISTTYIKVAQKGVANGVASLDANAKVPENQLPDSVAYQAILREW